MFFEQLIDDGLGGCPADRYCAKNQDPGCPLGSYIGPDAMDNPHGDGTWVPCEGTICTNPNHGAGSGTTAPAETPAPVEVASTTPQNPARSKAHRRHSLIRMTKTVAASG
ncbi:hypothetical protein ACFYO7_13255 [Nocardia salmonicida]|uniref:hypothetical protein n=1 Tax=Nocardia salmonicida TaxID=53431 RepID=UPI0036A4FA49